MFIAFHFDNCRPGTYFIHGRAATRRNQWNSPSTGCFANKEWSPSSHVASTKGYKRIHHQNQRDDCKQHGNVCTRVLHDRLTFVNVSNVQIFEQRKFRESWWIIYFSIKCSTPTQMTEIWRLEEQNPIEITASFPCKALSYLSIVRRQGDNLRRFS